MITICAMTRSGIRSRGMLRQLPRFFRRSEELVPQRAVEYNVSRQHPHPNNCNVPVGGEIPNNVHLDLIILVVLHLRATLTNKVTVQRIPRALRQGASLRRGNTSQCC